jgi:hypothetical protein
VIDLLSQIINLNEAVIACWMQLVPLLYILCYLVSFIWFLHVLFGGCRVNTELHLLSYPLIWRQLVISYDRSTLKWQQQIRTETTETAVHTSDKHRHFLDVSMSLSLLSTFLGMMFNRFPIAFHTFLYLNLCL